jgi:hypothetical protein
LHALSFLSRLRGVSLDSDRERGIVVVILPPRNHQVSCEKRRRQPSIDFCSDVFFCGSSGRGKFLHGLHPHRISGRYCPGVAWRSRHNQETRTRESSAIRVGSPGRRETLPVPIAELWLTLPPSLAGFSARPNLGGTTCLRTRHTSSQQIL